MTTQLNLRSTSPADLRNLLASRPAQSPVLNEQAMQKIAHDAMARYEQQRQHALRVKQAAARRQQEVRAMTVRSIEKISHFRALATLQESGFELKPEVLAMLPQLRKESEAEEEALTSAVVEQDALKEEMMQDLMDGAAEDPVVAAKLLEEELGADVDPQQVEDASDQVADVMVKEEVHGGNSKESSAARAQVAQMSEHWSEFTKQVILARSTYKASQALHYLANHR